MSVWVQNLVFTVLGAVLGMLSGIFTEGIRTRNIRKATAKALKILVQDEIDSISTVLERLIDNRKTAGSFRLDYLNEIAAIRVGYDRNRDNIIVSFPAATRKSVSFFYHKLLVGCTGAIGIENLALDPSKKDELKDFIKQRRDELLSDFTQLQTQLQSTRSQIDSWAP